VVKLADNEAPLQIDAESPMTGALDIYRAAKLVIDRHGEDAPATRPAQRRGPQPSL